MDKKGTSWEAWLFYWSYRNSTINMVFIDMTNSGIAENSEF
jgi:hypothetical protein